MHAAPIRTGLKKKYAIKETEQHRAEEISADLWHAVRNVLSPTINIECLRDMDALAPIISERLVNYTFSRLIIGGCYWLDNNGIPEDQLKLIDGMLEGVREVLDIPNKDIEQRIAFFMSRICVRITRKQSQLTTTQAKGIRRFAVDRGHRCYLCGVELHYGPTRPFGSDSDEFIIEKRDKRSFEIEHIWGQARGGSRSNENLAASCKNCNKLKSHHISFVDLPIEQVITNAKDKKSIGNAINQQYRFALIWKQGGQCCYCDKHFYEIDNESIYLVKREKTQPMHFLNLQVACHTCNDKQSLEGVRIRA